MLKKKTVIIVLLSTVVAFCTASYAYRLGEISNSNLKQYTTAMAKEGSLAVPAASRALYKDALGLLKVGKWEEAKEKLLISAQIDDEFAQPLFTLARVELLHGDADFLPHLVSGLARSVGTFKNQALFLANSYILLAAGLVGALFVVTLALVLKYHPFFTHKLRENYKKKYSFPNDRWFMIILLVSLAAMRLGLALYIAIFTVLTFQFAAKREKSTVIILALLLIALSIYSPITKPVAVALDPESATYKFWSLNRGTNSGMMLKELEKIDNPALAVEKEFALGTTLVKLGRFGEAREHLLKAIEKRKDFAAAYINLGNMYYISGDYDRALVGYMNALEADSSNAIAYYNLGQTYIKKLLFAKSSSSLKRANELGIEDLKSRYTVITDSEPDIFTAQFDSSQLWRCAKIEVRDRKVTCLDDIFRPILLVPFRYLWAVVLSGLLLSVIASKVAGNHFDVVKCDNCGNDTCSMCSNKELEITLCHECAKLIDGLSSVKVMEALLRHRRQKVLKNREKKERWKMFVFPGMAHIFHGKPATGGTLAFVSSISIAWLAWGGGYFKDIFGVGGTFSIWKILPPVTVLVLAFLSSTRSRPAVEPRNYRILPAELHQANRETKEEETKEKEKSEEREKEPVMHF